MKVFALTLGGGNRYARLVALRPLAFVAATIVGACVLPAYADGLGATPATPGTPPTPRRLSEGEIQAIERSGGASATDCVVARRSMRMVFQYRQTNMPIDSAEDFLYDKSNSDRSNRFMLSTVKEIYEDPTGMAAFVASGDWTKSCIKAIRGF